ncbi:hypothetical protein [Streptomyces sp. NPDC002573]|uniref:hypothetical protein n=1 Tax=Streptomyces sp. NPDC002573 TaxID=3364651 RepID=UPI0036CFB60F
MVRARYMSLLSTFSDSEIEKGIEEMRVAHPEPVLVFADRFAFVLGRRREESARAPWSTSGCGACPALRCPCNARTKARRRRPTRARPEAGLATDDRTRPAE